VRTIVAVNADGLIRIENIPEAGRDRSVRKTVGLVEAALVYPLLRGRDVAAWLSVPSGYVVVPYDPDSPAELLTQTSFDRFPATYTWLSRHRTFLSNRSTPPTRNWKMRGDDWCRLDGPIPHLFAGHLVVVREMQNRPAAAVVEPRYDDRLKRITRPMVDHKLTFCSVSSLDEAAYLAAFINSTPVQDLLASFANQVGVSPQTLARLPIPSFEPEQNLEAATLARLGLAVLRAPDRAAEALAREQEVDETVLRLLNQDPTQYQPQPRRRTSRSRVAKDAAGTTPLF
jgi:hypothetical protein